MVLSLKASSIDLSVKAYKLAAKEFPYPLHVGITEAGTSFKGLIKSSIGLTKTSVEDLSLKLKLTGFGYAIKRINLVDKTGGEI